MIKRYCDPCGALIEGGSAASNRIKVKAGRIEVEVMVGLDGTWNQGDVCRNCVIAVLAPEGGDLARAGDDLSCVCERIENGETGIDVAIATRVARARLDVVRHRCAPAPSVATPPQEGGRPILVGGEHDVGPWLHDDGSTCDVFLSDRPYTASGGRWWCTEHQSHLTPAAPPAEAGKPTDVGGPDLLNEPAEQRDRPLAEGEAASGDLIARLDAADGDALRRAKRAEDALRSCEAAYAAYREEAERREQEQRNRADVAEAALRDATPAPEGGDLAEKELTDALEIVRTAQSELRSAFPDVTGWYDLGWDDLDRAARLIIKWRPSAVRARSSSSVAAPPQKKEEVPEFWWSQTAATEGGFGSVPRDGLIERHRLFPGRFCVHRGVGWTVIEALPADAVPLRAEEKTS